MVLLVEGKWDADFCRKLEGDCLGKQWIDETGDGSDEDATDGLPVAEPEPEPDETAAVIEQTGEPSSNADDVPSEYNQEAAENVIEDRAGERAPERALPIICPIVGDPMLGDKDPKVVQWWKDNHPEEFKNRYSGRRLQSKSGIIY